MKVIENRLDTRTDLKKALDKIVFELPTQLEIINTQAKLAKSQFDSLVKEGFTEIQAMEIITKQPIWR